MTHSKRLFFLLNDILFPLFPMLLWGSLFPMIKIGYMIFMPVNTSIITNSS